MKMDAGEKELARLRRARAMEICSWRQARANALRQGHVPQGRRLNIDSRAKTWRRFRSGRSQKGCAPKLIASLLHKYASGRLKEV